MHRFPRPRRAVGSWYFVCLPSARVLDCRRRREIPVSGTCLPRFRVRGTCRAKLARRGVKRLRRPARFARHMCRAQAGVSGTCTCSARTVFLFLPHPSQTKRPAPTPVPCAAVLELHGREAGRSSASTRREALQPSCVSSLYRRASALSRHPETLSFTM